MTIAQNSLLVRFLMAVWVSLRTGWDESVPGRVFARLGAAIRHGVEGSWLCQFIWREGTLPCAWPHSLACRVLMVILNLPVRFVQWLYKVGRNLFDNSLAFRFASAVGGAGFVFVGLSMLLMLIVPHESWNNAYTLLCMYAVVMIFLAGSMARRRHSLDLDKLGPYYTIFIGFICYGFLSGLSTQFDNGILQGLVGEGNLSWRFFVFHMIAFLITVLLVSSVQKVEQLQLVLVITVAGLVVAALYGCTELTNKTVMRKAIMWNTKNRQERFPSPTSP